MKKRILHICSLVALMASGGLAAEDQPAEQADAAPPSGDTTIATINGQEIPLDLFRHFYAARMRQGNAQNTSAFQNQAFNEFVNIVVTAQDAEKAELDKGAGFELALKLQRLQLLSSIAIQNAAKTRKPSDEDLKKAYDERFGKDKRIEYKARHILVKTEDEGEKVIDELKGGADFAELAKTHSLGPTGKDGGELPWFDTGQMVQPFTEATTALKPGEHSSEPVQTQFGWHVILLEETRESDPPALDEVKEELTAALQRNTLGGYVAELREKADLQLNPDLIKSSAAAESTPAEANAPSESK
jgi:peptidyl-prolyl cis-trans isomerase C